MFEPIGSVLNRDILSLHRRYNKENVLNDETEKVHKDALVESAFRSQLIL